MYTHMYKHMYTHTHVHTLACAQAAECMPQQLHSKRTATPGKAVKLFFPQAREVDMLIHGF